MAFIEASKTGSVADTDAEHITYDNTESGLESENVQGAIDEVVDNIDEINDNLAQTPIEVGGETLSTIDNKLNYLLANKIAINDLLKLYEGNNDYTYVSDFNGKMLVILGVTSRYNTSFSLTVNGNSVNPLLTSTYANGIPTYTHSNYAIYVVDIEAGQSVTSSVSYGSTSDQAFYGKFIGFYKMQ